MPFPPSSIVVPYSIVHRDILGNMMVRVHEHMWLPDIYLCPSPASPQAAPSMEEPDNGLVMGLAPVEGYRTTGYVYDERMLLHREIEDGDHPEQPGRLQTIMEHLQETDILERCVHVRVRDAATNDLLGTVHTPAHLEFMCSLQGTGRGGGDGALNHATRTVLGQDEQDLLRLGDTMDSLYLCKDSDSAARTAVACTVGLARKVAKGELRNGFAIVRPPGHHAEPHKVPSGWGRYRR